MKKIILTTALVLSTASAAMAFDFDPNMANRYPSYAAPGAGDGRTQRRADGPAEHHADR